MRRGSWIMPHLPEHHPNQNKALLTGAAFIFSSQSLPVPFLVGSLMLDFARHGIWHLKSQRQVMYSSDLVSCTYFKSLSIHKPCFQYILCTRDYGDFDLDEVGQDFFFFCCIKKRNFFPHSLKSGWTCHVCNKFIHEDAPCHWKDGSCSFPYMKFISSLVRVNVSQSAALFSWLYVQIPEEINFEM